MKVVLGSGGPPLTDSAKKKKKDSLLFGVRDSLKSHLSEKIAIRMHRRFQSFSGGRSRKDSKIYNMMTRLRISSIYKDWLDDERSDVLYIKICICIYEF